MRPVAFVTGGTGFVGSHLVEALIEDGFEVRCLVRDTLKWLEGLNILPVHGTLHQPDVIEKGISGADFVFHAGAVTRSRTNAMFERENVAATEMLLEAIRKQGANIKRTVLFSSQAAAGPSDHPKLEEEETAPISMYGESKRAMEEMAHRYFQDIPVTIVRAPAVYGPRETDILTFIQTVDKRLCPIVGDGRSRRINIVYVADVISGIRKLIGSDEAVGQILHLGGNQDHSWIEIRDAVVAALGKRALTVHIPEILVPSLGAVVEGLGNLFGIYPPLNREKAREARNSWCFSSEKAIKLIGYQPEVGLAEGMRKTVSWYRANGWL